MLIGMHPGQHVELRKKAVVHFPTDISRLAGYSGKTPKIKPSVVSTLVP